MDLEKRFLHNFDFLCVAFLIFVLQNVCSSVATPNSELEYVTCGSVIKLFNTKHTARLHSHEVKYGSGSGQQSVTAVTDMDDENSHWAIKGQLNTPCVRGEPIKCEEIIRLQHQTTGCYLHSHFFESPLSHNQEVSCFGDDNQSDTGDYWVVQCDGTHWERNDDTRLKHKDTGGFLGVSPQKYGRPIKGQSEVCAFASLSGAVNWHTAEGIFIKPSGEL